MFVGVLLFAASFCSAVVGQSTSYGDERNLPCIVESTVASCATSLQLETLEKKINAVVDVLTSEKSGKSGSCQIVMGKKTKLNWNFISPD